MHYQGEYKILFPQFIEVNDCIIIDINNEIKVEKINLNKILSIFGDRTDMKLMV